MNKRFQIQIVFANGSSMYSAPYEDYEGRHQITHERTQEGMETMVQRYRTDEDDNFVIPLVDGGSISIPPEMMKVTAFIIKEIKCNE